MGLKNVFILFTCILFGQMTFASESPDSPESEGDTPKFSFDSPSVTAEMFRPEKHGESVEWGDLIHDLELRLNFEDFSYPNMHLAADIVLTLSETGHLSKKYPSLDTIIVDVSDAHKGLLEALLYRFGSKKYQTKANREHYKNYFNPLVEEIRCRRGQGSKEEEEALRSLYRLLRLPKVTPVGPSSDLW